MKARLKGASADSARLTINLFALLEFCAACIFLENKDVYRVKNEVQYIPWFFGCLFVNN